MIIYALKILKEWWFLVVPLFSFIIAFFIFIRAMIEGIKCSLRNDILSIYDECKKDKKISHFQLEAIQHSADLYFKLKGNSFVKEIVDRVLKFELDD